MEPNEVREDLIRRLAKNRYEMRVQFRWRLNDSAEDDWRAAEDMVRIEEMRNDY